MTEEDQRREGRLDGGARMGEEDDSGVRKALADGEVKEGMRKLKRKVGHKVRFDSDDHGGDGSVFGDGYDNGDGVADDLHGVHGTYGTDNLQHTQPQQPASLSTQQSGVMTAA